jgi:hypothetical protein
MEGRKDRTEKMKKGETTKAQRRSAFSRRYARQIHTNKHMYGEKSKGGGGEWSTSKTRIKRAQKKRKRQSGGMYVCCRNVPHKDIADQHSKLSPPPLRCNASTHAHAPASFGVGKKATTRKQK